MPIRSFSLTLAALVVAVPMAQAAGYAGGAIKTMKTDKGTVLVDEKGMTLYSFDKDGKGASNCYGACAVNWPPLTAAKDAKPQGKFSIVERKDGAAQWAVSGKPLYLWGKDKKPGDTTGDGVKGVWHVVKD